jgi:uncharacterized delta-60 repeat protein
MSWLWATTARGLALLGAWLAVTVFAGTATAARRSAWRERLMGRIGVSRLPSVLVVVLAMAATVPALAAGAPGELDASFGSGGQVTFPLSLRGFPQGLSAESVALGTSGKIEVIGTASSGGGEWRIFAARLLEDGQLDTSFGSAGTVITSADPKEDEGTGVNVVQPVNAGVVEPDGSIVGVGNRVQVRLTASGQLDPSFENGSSPLDSYALMQLPGGDLLAAGEDPTEGRTQYPALERMLPSGAPDATFGNEGVVTLPNHPGEDVLERARAALLLPDGEILLAGDGGVDNPQVGQAGFGWLAEVTASGSLDPSFGTGGIDYVPAQYSYEHEVAIAREPDGEVLLASEQETGSEHWQAAVWGFTASGAADPTFGTDGVARIPATEPGGEAFSSALTIDGQGYIYLAANQDSSTGTASGAYIARLTPAGRLDTTFAHEGIAAFTGPAINSLVVDGEGRLIAAGGHRRDSSDTDENVFLARLFGGMAPTIPGPSPQLPSKPSAKAVPLLRGSASCKTRRRRLHDGKRERIERCTLSLRDLTGRWKTLEVILTRNGHRVARELLKRVRMPTSFTVDVPASKSTLRWIVTVRQGKRLGHDAWTVALA